MGKKIISVGILRARLRLSGYLPPCVFAFLCIYFVYTVYVLMILGNSAIMAVSNGLLYMMTQAPSYFLLYAPAMAVLLSGLMDTGAFELMIFARTDSRREYVYGKLLAIFSFIVFCMICALMTDAIICNCCKVITKKPKKYAPGCPAKSVRRRSPKSDMRVKSVPPPYRACFGCPGLQFPATLS